MAKIKEAFMHDVLRQYTKEEISFSRMVELLNEEAERQLRPEKSPNVFSRPECVYHYCPTPELCKEKCKLT